MKAGSLDRSVTFLRRSQETESTYGTKSVAWVPLATVSAAVKEVLAGGAEDPAGNVTLALRRARVTIRWRADVSQANLVEIDGRRMRIVSGPVELGRRVGLEMIVEELSTEGQKP